MPDVSLVTPTSDRLEAVRILRDYVGRLRVKGIDVEWILVDDGSKPVRDDRQLRQDLFTTNFLENGVRRRYYRRDPSITPLESFAGNLLKALGKAEGHWILVLEDDDWYHPRYVEWMVRFLHEYDLVGLGANGIYYHVGVRRWRTVDHRNSTSLSRMAFSRGILGEVFRVVDETAARGSHSFDWEIWAHSGRFPRILTEDPPMVVSMKGLPGRRGMGSMHDPKRYDREDPELFQLRAWIGRDASRYERFRKRR